MSVDKFHKGERLSARHLNQLVDTLRKNIRGGKGITVNRGGDRITIASTVTAPIPIGGGSGGVTVVSNYAALVAITGADNGDLGYIYTGAQFYGRRAGAWRALGGMFNGTLTPASAKTSGAVDGDLLLFGDYLMQLEGNTWHHATPFVEAPTPNSGFIRNGDQWFDTVNSRSFVYRSGAWESMAWAKSDDKLYYYDADADTDQLVSHLA